MADSLTSLPAELIRCMVSHLGSNATDLRNLGQCSHQLYVHTIPYLYRHVTVEEEILGGRCPETGPLRGLASLLIGRPAFAGLVRHFTLLVSEYSAGECGGPEPAECQVDEAFKTAVSTSGFSEKDQRILLANLADSRNCCHDVILALLLPALVKVECLVLQCPVPFKTHFLERTIRRVARLERPFDIQPPCQALAVFVYPHSMPAESSMGFIASLLKLPAIQKISVGYRSRGPQGLRISWSEFHENWADKELAELESFSSPLTHLELAGTKPKAAELRHILRAPKALKSFFYRVDPSTHLNFIHILETLRPHEHCLENLGLDYCHRHDINYLQWLGCSNHFGPMPSLVNFSTLKVFKTPVVFLEETENGTGGHKLIDVFPPSLETLHLTRVSASSGSVLEAVEHLLAHKSPQQNPWLRRLILEQGIGSFGLRPDKYVNRWHTKPLKSVLGELPGIAAAQEVSIHFIGDIYDEVYDEDTDQSEN